ncbi:MAG: hypothetical protein ACPLPR_04045 [Bacillota bacterium]
MARLARALVVSALIFVGSATAIMNFHSDVSMKQVQSEVYRMLTGVRTDRPLLLQVPYSIGVAVGVYVFFNHIRLGGTKDEPSPLEVEMFLYDKNVKECMKGRSKGKQ